MLACEGLEVAYGPVIALRGVSLHVDVGECVALLGSNGAGKTTLLRALSGLIRPRGGAITFDGARMAGLSPEKRVRAGLAHAPERRRIFPGLTVRENLEVRRRRGDAQASPAPPTSTASTRCSPVLRNGQPSMAGRFQAASNRCSPWVAP